MDNLDPKWRSFLKHLGSYVIIIGMLAVINLMTSSDSLWFVWPAMGWGIGLAFHFLSTILGDEREEATADRFATEKRARRDELRARHRAKKMERTRETSSLPVEPSLKAGKMASSTLQAHVEKALAYQGQIDNMIRTSADEIAGSRLRELGAEVTDWVKAIKDLARRVDSFQQNALIGQDLEMVPKAIEDLEARLANEADADVRTQLERTLANRKNQLASLEQLRSTIKRAEIQIESTVSSLGTIYSQLLTGQSTDYVADHSRLLADVDEEVHRLRDQLEALEEVKFGRS